MALTKGVLTSIGAVAVQPLITLLIKPLMVNQAMPRDSLEWTLVSDMLMAMIMGIFL